MISYRGKMAEFILSEAVDDDHTTTIDNDNEGNIVNMTLSDEEFIDDSFVQESVTERI